ncbi:MAG: hypothetical protein K1060chlam5_01351 [Candidatus Anoxychlamydiales bacterium]|nr:hypothetical protein [Candidatus Anoxychlamydiales bacterium]
MDYFFDNGVLRSLTKKSETKKDLGKNWNKFYDNVVIKHEPDFKKKGLGPLFGWDIFIEFVGLGEVIEKIKTELTNFEEKNDANDFILNPEQFIDNLFDLARNAFLKNESLSQTSLLEKIKKQKTYSGDDASNDLISLTLNKCEKFIKEKDHEDLINYLAWEVICGYSYFHIEQISKLDDHEKIINNAIDYYGCLAQCFNDFFKDKKSVRYYRLGEAQYFTIKKLEEKRDKTDVFQKWLEKNYPKNKQIKSNLNNFQDFADVALIDYACLGYLENKVTCFTFDEPKIMKARIGVFCRAWEMYTNVEGWELKINPGVIYCLSRNDFSVIEKISVEKLIPENIICSSL